MVPLQTTQGAISLQDRSEDSLGLPPSSLIICSRNRPQLLFETVQSVLAGTEVPAEMVVIDQSTERHPALSGLDGARGCRLRYLHSDSVGLSRGRNLGISAAQHEVLVIIDDDMFVDQDWFAVFVRALVRAGERAVVTGRVLPGAAETSGGFVPALVSDPVAAEYEGRLWTDVLAGGHMAAYRSALRAAGCFDERLGAGAAFPAADDNDLGFRLLEAGYRILYVPEAIVHHRAWRPRREYYLMRWRYGLGKGGFYAKYARRSDHYGWRRMARDIAGRARLFPRHLLYDQRQAVGDLLYTMGIISGAIRWFGSER